MSYNVTETLLGNILGTPFAMSEGNMAIVDINAPGTGSVGGEDSAPDGTWANPYRSIQAAVDATPTPTVDPATWLRIIIIFSGTYDEHVVVTQPNIMVFLTLGQVVLSGSVPVGPVPPVDQRFLVWSIDAAPPVGISPSLSVLPLDDYPSFRGSANRFWVTGNIVMGGDAGDPINSERSLTLKHVRAGSVTWSEGAGSVGDPGYIPRLEGKINVQMERCNVEGWVSLPDDIVRYTLILEDVEAQKLDVKAGPGSVGASDSVIRLMRCRIHEDVHCPEATWALCQDTEIGDSGSVGISDSEMWDYGHIENSTFYNGLTIHDTTPPFEGRFTDSIIYGTITAGAGMLRLDPVTNYYINTIPATVGAGVRTLIHDETIT